MNGWRNGGESEMLTVEEVTSQERIAELQAVWDGLLAASGVDNIFSTHAWISTWWKHFSSGLRPLILLVKDGAEVIGIFPWMVRRTGKPWMPVHRIQFLGTGLSDRLDLILATRRAEQVQCVLDYLQRRPALWDVIDLQEVPGESATIPVLRALLERRRWGLRIHPDSTCPYIPIQGDWATYYSSVHGAETRKTNRKKLRRLEREGELTMRRLGDAREEPQIIDRLRAMPHSELYLGRKRVSLFDDGARKAFFEEMTGRLAAPGCLDLSVVELSGKVIAYRYGWHSPQKYYDYFADHDPAYAYFSPGTLLLLRVLEDCFGRGLQEFDFLRGDEPYKLAWTDKHRQNLRIMLFRPSLRGRLLRLAYGARSASRP